MKTYKRTVAAEARHQAMKLASKRKRPYRGKYPVHTAYGTVPFYESEFVLARRIKARRAEYQRTCDYYAAKGIDFYAEYEAFKADGELIKFSVGDVKK